MLAEVVITFCWAPVTRETIISIAKSTSVKIKQGCFILTLWELKLETFTT